MMQPAPNVRALEAVARSLSQDGQDGSTAPAQPPHVSAVRMGTADTWLLRANGRALILKRYRRGQDETDVQWEHPFLDRLAATRFPAPAGAGVRRPQLAPTR